jgi:hypothetical protein
MPPPCGHCQGESLLEAGANRIGTSASATTLGAVSE